MGCLRLDGVALTPLVVLGATGSIGSQTLEVADRLGIEVVGLAARRASTALAKAAARYPGARLVVADESPAVADLRRSVGPRVHVGSDAVAELAVTPRAIVVNGIVGAAGLEPTIAALAAGNRVALANKESLITAGPLVRAAARAGGGELIPVDSEHSAIWQCLVGEDRRRIERLVLTASGGPFHGRARADLVSVTPSEALAHPTWEMGPRISIDSATLMNKAFEVIEAHHLFDVDFDRIDVVVHPQSYVHSLVEFSDGVVKAELGPADMRKPIQYALTYPERVPISRTGLDLMGRTLTFEPPDREAFPCLDLGYEAGRRGGTAPAVLNAADEIAVAAFLEGRIGFGEIADIVATTMATVASRPIEHLEDVARADAAGRDIAAGLVAKRAT